MHIQGAFQGLHTTSVAFRAHITSYLVVNFGYNKPSTAKKNSTSNLQGWPYWQKHRLFRLENVNQLKATLWFCCLVLFLAEKMPQVWIALTKPYRLSEYSTDVNNIAWFPVSLPKKSVNKVPVVKRSSDIDFWRAIKIFNGIDN